MRENNHLRRVPEPQRAGRCADRGARSAAGAAWISAAAKAASAAPANGMSNRGLPVLGYASGAGRGEAAGRQLVQQAEVIARECDRRSLELVEVVHEREPANGKALSRPGLSYAVERIARGEASGLVVSELSRITRSAAELGTVIEWLGQSNARLIAAAHGLDTDEADGRLAAELLVEVSRWESARLSERTRNGLQAARRNGRVTGRPAVVDDPYLKDRIAQMRAEGMTLQAIADRLNEEGVPTVRGGSRWRHSSVQAAAGYRRRPRVAPVVLQTTTALADEPASHAASG